MERGVEIVKFFHVRFQFDRPTDCISTGKCACEGQSARLHELNVPDNYFIDRK